ncbi:MAG: V-type ATPase subunit [Candidatus Gracilibacteria bacterium]|jgi:V/A-type H+-transporting ATPase subunit C|nr:V-type ATPase subunit [Candidatus Gracilibacteria bacterium]
MLKKDFIFSVARIRALESRLLSQAQVERMVSAKDAKEAFKILNDLDWAEFLGEAEKPEDFEHVLEAGLIEVKNLINSAVDYNGDFDFLWMFYDMHNVKVLIKNYLKGDDSDIRNILSGLGTVSADTMHRIIFEDQKIENFEFLLEFKEQLKKDFEENYDPEKIDLMIEDAFFSKIRPLAMKMKSPMMHRFYTRYIDMQNINSFLRRADFDKECNGFCYFVKGGDVKECVFKKSKNLEDFVSNIKCDRLREIIVREMKEGEIESFLRLENALDEFLFEELKSSKMEHIGPDAIFAFFWQKRRNAQIIRSIMVGKLSNIDEKQIRTWLKTPSLSL